MKCHKAWFVMVPFIAGIFVAEFLLQPSCKRHWKWRNFAFRKHKMRSDVTVKHTAVFGIPQDESINLGDPAYMRRMLSVRMKKRRTLISEVCHKYWDGLLPQYASSFNVSPTWEDVNISIASNPDFLVDRAQRIGWCKVPKTASTSMVHALLRSMGQGHLIDDHPRGRLHTLLRDLMPHLTQEDNPGRLESLILVRHPFSRLLSAYSDKLLFRSNYHQFAKFRKNYGLNIISRFRKETPTSKEYGDIPTFREFIEYIISTPTLDFNEHWRPYYFICTPCHIPFMAIIRAESMEEDWKFLEMTTRLRKLKILHLHSSSTVYPQLRLDERGSHSARNRSEHLGNETQEGRFANTVSHSKMQKVNKRLRDISAPVYNTDALSKRTDYERHYFSQITEEMLIKLYDVYRIDFEMFGYSVSPYDEYVSPDSP